MKANTKGKKRSRGERRRRMRSRGLRKSKRKKSMLSGSEGHEGKEEMTTQEKCVETKKETTSMHEESDVSNRLMTWWKNAGWIRVDGGPHMRTAGRRRRIWRAARRAAELARDDGRVEETWSLAEEAEGETKRRRKGERQTRQCNGNTLHLAIHLTATTTATTTSAAAAAATAAVRLQ